MGEIANPLYLLTKNVFFDKIHVFFKNTIFLELLTNINGLASICSCEFFVKYGKKIHSLGIFLVFIARRGHVPLREAQVIRFV